MFRCYNSVLQSIFVLEEMVETVDVLCSYSLPAAAMPGAGGGEENGKLAAPEGEGVGRGVGRGVRKVRDVGGPSSHRARAELHGEHFCRDGLHDHPCTVF